MAKRPIKRRMAKAKARPPSPKKLRNYAATDLTRINLRPLKRRVGDLTILIADILSRLDKLEHVQTVPEALAQFDSEPAVNP
jgi:hypothetical protein